MPGAYYVVWGERDVPLATPEMLREASRERPSELDVGAMGARRATASRGP